MEFDLSTTKDIVIERKSTDDGEDSAQITVKLRSFHALFKNASTVFE